MKKSIGKVVTSVVMATLLLAGAACGNTENTAPKITGAADIAVMAGNEINLLSGVSATDAEDGDLTSVIRVETMPELTIKNGTATPDTAGSYEITYSVTDKAGEVAKEYATLTVTKETAEKALYKEFDFAEGAKADAGMFTASVSGSAAGSAELSEGAYTFKITNPGGGDGDVQLALFGLDLQKADYTVKIWAKSTVPTYCHLLAVDADASEWKTFGGAYNVVIGEAVQPLTLNFSAEDGNHANLLMNMGKISPNPDNPEDTTPSEFTVYVDKVEIYEISGTETAVPFLTCDFDAAEEIVTVEAGDGAVASAEITDAARVSIDSYPTSGGVWSIKANILLGDVTVEEGKKYYYSFKVNADNAQGGECLVESMSQYDAQRANFAGFSVNGGEETTVSGSFVAEKTVEDPVIRLQIGNPSDGVTSNTIAIDSVEFGELTGDKETKKTIYAFADKYDMIKTFNGTDEDNDLGVGTIYTADDKLVYRIDQGGVTDWHNKLIIGTGEAPLVLESDSYYTVEITAKADKNVHCGFFLNPQGGWDPRIADGMDITTESKTFTFRTTETLILDMNFEMLFQFGSDATKELGKVNVEFENISIYQEKVTD